MKRRNRGRKATPKPGAPVNKILTLHEVADYLHCHFVTVCRLIKAGLPTFRLGTDWRFQRVDVESGFRNSNCGRRNPRRLRVVSET